MDWMQRFDDLLNGRHTSTDDELDAGAQLVVTDPDGSEAFRAALARHYRIDPDDRQLIWVRPVVAGFPMDSGPRAFNLSIARRRGLRYTDAQLEKNGDVVLHLANDQTGCIQAAAGQELADLQDWDTFYLWVLTDDERAQLDQLDFDYSDGRFS
jgi:hypothetical protein